MKKVSVLLNLMVALSMVLAFVATAPNSVGAQSGTPPAPKTPLKGELLEEAAQFLRSAEMTNPLDKIDPKLRNSAQKGGAEEVSVYVSVRTGVDLSKFLTRIIERPAVLKGVHNVYGRTTADKLLSIAQLTGVVAVVSSDKTLADRPADPEDQDKPEKDLNASKARIQALRQTELTYQEAAAKENGLGASGWYDVLDGHKDRQAWDKGFTGEGVVVAVLDDGVDFAHPDMQGTYAWVTDDTSPYFGWPMAFSQVSMQYFAEEVYYQDLGANGITQGWAGTRWSDTQTSIPVATCSGCTTGSLSYQPLDAGSAHNYTIPLTSLSEVYKVGTSNETYLEVIYGEKVAVLVVDENVAGEYDTVYVDLDGDFDFTDEKPVTKDSPEVYRDMDGDGFADISGGLLVWISDGENPPPGADWLWGVSCGDEVGTLKACPDDGELLIFTGPFDFDPAGSHGTLCASNVAAQGKISGGLSAQPFRLGGMVQGAAPDVGVMDFSNHYYSGTDEDEYLMASLGYDGAPMSGDEVQVLSNSYGNFTQMWGSWGYFGRLVTSLNLALAPSTVWVFSGGNEGPGYGPQEGEAGPTILKVGTSTQFGSTNWDSIAGLDQVVYGDPSSFGAHGPNRDGTSGLDVLANGGRGSGDANLNYAGFNGATAFETWGGTSRSSPAAAGNLALLFQAFSDRYGRWPTWDEVIPIAKNSATNSVSSPFLQGAGVLNADRMTDVAAGVYGVYATPDEWQVGDWEGQEYLNFAKVAWPNSTYEKTYTVKNLSGYEITVDLSDGYMQKFDEFETEFTTSNSSEESSFNFHTPDYLAKLNPADIPADTELMVVRYIQPYDSFDTTPSFSGTPNNSWRFMLYNWKDLNGDGWLWVDKNKNGAVNHVDTGNMDNDGFFRPDFADPETEVQEGEYVRMDYEFGGTGIPLFIHDPLERMQDGYFFGFQHRIDDGSVPQTTFKIGVEFYKRTDWPWLELDKNSLLVPAEGEAEFTASMNLPTDVNAGAYEGVIYMNDPGDDLHPAHESALPVVVNVVHALEVDGAVQVGAGPLKDTLYQNGWTNGYFNWYGGGWTGAGDWRHYFFTVDENLIPANDEVIDQNLLIHTYWDDDYPTDVNTWVLGPTADCASNGEGRCPWWESAGLDIMPIPDVYGPYTLQPIGSSSPFVAGAAYPFETSTGGPDDWLSVPLENAGLHELALHNVLYSGDELYAMIGSDIGTLSMEATMDPANGRIFKSPIEARVFNESGDIDLWFTPSLEIPNLHATLAGGLETVVSPTQVKNVPNNNGGLGGNYDAFEPDNVYETFQVDVVGTTQLKVHVQPGVTSDVDLFLVLDNNLNGVPDLGIDTRVGASGNSTGAAEEITLANPALGQYIVVFNGYSMDPSTGSDVEWWFSTTSPGPLPTEVSEIYSGTISLDQDDPSNWSTGYEIDFSTTERTAGLHASLTNIPVGNDVDLYLTDGGGNILVQSKNFGNVDESLDWLPDPAEYRFGAGENFKLWVHGFNVTGTIEPNLAFTSDELNVWLAQPLDADVSVSEIGANETVSVTLKYAKTGMQVGDFLSTRLIAGPNGLPEALKQLINITMVDSGDFPDVSAEATKWVEGERGETYIDDTYGIPFVPAYPGDVLLYTISVKNTGTEPGVINPFDYWRNDRFDFIDWVGPEPPEWYHFTFVSGATTYEALDVYVELMPGEEVTYQYEASKTVLPDPLGYTPGTYFTANVLEVYQYFESNYDFLTYAQAAIIYAGWDDAAKADMDDRSEKTAPEYVAPDETFHFLLHLHNPTAYDTATLYVTDELPVEVDYVNVSAPSGTPAYDSGTHTVTWEGVVPPAGLDVDVEVTADSTLVDGDWIYNEFSIAESLGGEPFAWAYSYTDIDDGVAPELKVSKTVDKLVGKPGDTLNYVISLRNVGTETAYDAFLVDVHTDYLDIDCSEVTAPSEPARLDEGFLVWEGDLGVGESLQFDCTAEIEADAPSDLVLINGALAWAGNNPDWAYQSAVTEVEGPAQILRLDLIESVDQTAWEDVPGELETGWSVELDYAVDYHYLDATNLISSRPLAEGYHPFYIASPNPGGWFPYWASRGVCFGCPGPWQPTMWQIICGYEPIFYLKVWNDNGKQNFMLVDGLTKQLGGGDTHLRVDGSYLSGLYYFVGHVEDTTGNVLDLPVNLLFYRQLWLPAILSP